MSRPSIRVVAPTTPTMTYYTTSPFAFSVVRGRKITADFDGGRLISDGGVMLLAMAERRLGIAARLARLVPDRRGPARVRHTPADTIRARIVAMGYEDADDLDHLRRGPAFKLACGRLPDSGDDLCSQPTVFRLAKVLDADHPDKEVRFARRNTRQLSWSH